MTEKYVKFIQAFYAAKRVNHYYWLHTEGDGEGGNDSLISIENIQKIIELMTGFSISKMFLDEDSEFHRAFVERFDGGRVNVIYVLRQDEDWKRFSAVKELCHILIDSEEDFQPNPDATVLALKYDTGLFDEASSPEKDSEHLAEIIALELIYPLEYRRIDRQRLADGVSLDQIARERVVPKKYVSLGTSDSWFEICQTIWPTLADVKPANLNDMLGEPFNG
jgi:hypothetical protein